MFISTCNLDWADGRISFRSSFLFFPSQNPHNIVLAAHLVLSASAAIELNTSPKMLRGKIANEICARRRDTCFEPIKCNEADY